MINLVLAISCSVSVSLIMRYSEEFKHDQLGKLVINYLTCLIWAFFLCDHFVLETTSLSFGLITGILLVGGLVLFQYNISQSGVILSGLYMRLGLMVPIILSIFLFHEIPTIMQFIGIVLAFVAIIYLNRQKTKQIVFSFSLLALLLVNGMCDAMNKVFSVYGLAALSSQFLFFSFFFALILCFGLMLIKKQRIGKWELVFGILLGIPNYFSSRFLLLSLNDVPALIAYPTYSIGAIIIITVLSMLLFKEKLTKTTVIAMMIILCAIVLLNL